MSEDFSVINTYMDMYSEAALHNSGSIHEESMEINVIYSTWCIIVCLCVPSFHYLHNYLITSSLLVL